MSYDLRRAAIAFAAVSAFTNLYAPQAILPLLAQEFGSGAAQVSLAMTSCTLAVALVAPFSGAVADVVGRKRMIASAIVLLVAPTFLLALSPSLTAFITLRFVQGLLLPPIFATLVAYIGEEWPPGEATRMTGIYISAGSFGGFLGRFLTGVLADWIGWRAAFAADAALTLACAVGVLLLLPREKQFVRATHIGPSLRQMVGHLRNPQLVATYAIGFGVLFNFVGSLTYVNFHLAAPPFNLTPALLGSIFVIYLLGTAAAPLTGRAVVVFGRKPFVLAALALWAVGIALTLAPALPVIILGLACTIVGGFYTQACSTSYVAITGKGGASTAVGLYVMAFYLGGSVGGALPGLAWNYGEWPAVAAMIATMLTIMALIVALVWPRYA
ncbi:MAG: MFS transporter [Variibacter sp.]|nr:MFS transporter [Variibacter sp.]